MDSVTLLERFWNELNEIEQKFLEDPKQFYEMETAMEESSRRFVADFIGGILTRMNSVLMDSPSRPQGYIKQRNDSRTLIGMLGDYKFTTTYCKCKNGGYTHPIEDIIGLDRNERMTEGAEVKLLKVAAGSSYAKAAKAIPTDQKISKTTVENKVHGIAEIIPYLAPKTKKIAPEELQKQIEQYKTGDIVRHKEYGPGIVIIRKNDRIKIDFGDKGIKEFLLTMCLEKGLLSRDAESSKTDA